LGVEVTPVFYETKTILPKADRIQSEESSKGLIRGFPQSGVTGFNYPRFNP